MRMNKLKREVYGWLVRGEDAAVGYTSIWADTIGGENYCGNLLWKSCWTFYPSRWMQFKIETWDVGIYQVRSALKDAGLASDELAALKDAHDALRAKLLPQVYSIGFLSPDVAYFE